MTSSVSANVTCTVEERSLRRNPAPSRFKNGVFRHHYVIQKNSSSNETEQRYLCRVLHFNRQKLMLIKPPSD